MPLRWRVIASPARVFTRRRTVAFLVAALVLPLAVSAEDKPDTRKLQASPIKVEATPIAAFNRIGGGAQTHFGKLDFVGGLVLTAPASSHFGGWSGLIMDEDGKSFLTVSDSGVWMTGVLGYKDGKPSGISNAVLGPIRASGDKELKKRRDRDAEAVALLDGTVQSGNVLISFEQNTRIARYAVSREGLSPPLSFLPMPAEVRSMRRNNGLETMTVMRGGPYKGAVVAMSERLLNRNHNHTGWIWTNAGTKIFHLSNIGDFELTDIASLEDGTLFVLERRFRWLEGVKMRIRRVNAADLKPGATVDGEILITATLEQEIDNMEALALTTPTTGEVILTLISDDNFNHYLQRTLLLQFALKGTEGTRATQAVKARPER